MKQMILISLALPLIGGTAFAASPDKAAQASIPFVDSGSIQSRHEDGENAIYVRGIGSQWYRGEFMSPCRDLPFAEAVGFDTGGGNSFDNFSTVIVRGQRCTLTSLVKSGPPPGNKKKTK